MKRSRLGPGKKALERGSTFEQRRSAMTRVAAISPASEQQRVKIRAQVCVVCQSSRRCDPAHLVPRSLGGDDDPRAVVALCRRHHRAYDDGVLSLLEYLEPHYRAELAYAVETVGLLRALERVTNCRWSPEPGPEARAA